MCPVHGLTEHLTILDGACVKCRQAKERENDKRSIANESGNRISKPCTNRPPQGT